MAVAPKVTLVTMAVSGPHDQGTWWRWEVDGPELDDWLALLPRPL